MFIKYIEGPLKATISSIGEFELNVPREVSEEIGQRLLKKNSLKFVEIKDAPKKKKGGE